MPTPVTFPREQECWQIVEDMAGRFEPVTVCPQCYSTNIQHHPERTVTDFEGRDGRVVWDGYYHCLVCGWEDERFAVRNRLAEAIAIAAPNGLRAFWESRQRPEHQADQPIEHWRRFKPTGVIRVEHIDALFALVLEMARELDRSDKAIAECVVGLANVIDLAHEASQV